MTATKKKTDPQNRIAVLKTSGAPLVIGSSPAVADVKRFVKEHNRRFRANEPGGPGGHPAVEVYAAYWFETDSTTNEYDFETAPKIALGDALKTPAPAE